MLSHTTIIISENNWWIIGANIATAIATCIAVITTLVLTYRQQAQRLKTHSSSMLVLSVRPRNSNVQLGSQKEACFTLNVTNMGLRHITVKSVIFEILGPSKRSLWSANVFNNRARLEQDQEAQYSLAFSKIPAQHIESLRNEKKPYKQVRWQIESTTGKKWIANYNHREGRLIFNFL